MNASIDPTQADEWEQMRAEWWTLTKAQLADLQEAVRQASGGELRLATVYTPIHDLCGLAGVVGYPLLGKIARALIETLRKGPDPLDDRMLEVARSHLAALAALHARDVRGEGGAEGVAVLARLAAVHA